MTGPGFHPAARRTGPRRRCTALPAPAPVAENDRLGAASWLRQRTSERRGLRSAARNAAQQFFERQQPLRMHQLEQAQFQVKAVLLGLVQIIERAQHDLQIARDLLFAEQQRGSCAARALIVRRSAATRFSLRPAWPSAHCAGSEPSAAPATDGLCPAFRSVFNCSISSALWPAATASSRRSNTAFGTDPISSRICSADSTGRPFSVGAEAIAWSMMESASRIDPSPASASSARAALRPPPAPAPQSSSTASECRRT